MLRHVLLVLVVMPAMLFGQPGLDALKRSADAGQRAFDRRVAAPGPPMAAPDKEPEFPGGAAAMQRYMVENTRHPAGMGETGEVQVRFVVGTDGHVGDVAVVRGLHPLADQEAVRVVSAMPHWAPGERDGRPVAVPCVVPVLFRP